MFAQARCAGLKAPRVDSEQSGKDSQLLWFSLLCDPVSSSTIAVTMNFFPDSIDSSACRKAESVKLLPIVYNDDPRNFVTHGVDKPASTILRYLVRTKNWIIKNKGSISANVLEPTTISVSVKSETTNASCWAHAAVSRPVGYIGAF